MTKQDIAKYGDLLTRLVVGLIFIIAGWNKLMGLGDTTQFFTKLGIPMAGIFAPVVAIVELVGGILIFLGLWTYVAATLLAIIMAVAILSAHNPMQVGWNGFKYPLLLLVVLIRYIGTSGFCNALSCFVPKRKKKK